PGDPQLVSKGEHALNADDLHSLTIDEVFSPITVAEVVPVVVKLIDSVPVAFGVPFVVGAVDGQEQNRELVLDADVHRVGTLIRITLGHGKLLSRSKRLG